MSYNDIHEREVKNADWYNWPIWWSDHFGPPHPTCYLVLYNDYHLTQLQNQGRVAVKYVYPTMASQEFVAAFNSKEGNKSLQKKLQLFDGTVRANDRYWRNIKNQFLAT